MMSFNISNVPATNLSHMKRLYLTYPNRIFHEPRGKSLKVDFDPNLSWTHYRTLMREKREDVRQFYEIEAAKNQWSTPQLERQMTSFLYERLEQDKKNSDRALSPGQEVVKLRALGQQQTMDFDPTPLYHLHLKLKLRRYLHDA